MNNLRIRRISNDLLKRLERRARKNGRSVEEEVRDILRNALLAEKQQTVGAGTRIAALFKGIGLEEPIPEMKGYPVRPMKFDD